MSGNPTNQELATGALDGYDGKLSKVWQLPCYVLLKTALATIPNANAYFKKTTRLHPS
jgi:hypothetical protein